MKYVFVFKPVNTASIGFAIIAIAPAGGIGRAISI
jgi:hypothetical protein